MEYVLIAIAVVGIVYFIHSKGNTNNNVNSTSTQLNVTEVTETIEQVTIVRNGVVEKGVLKRMAQGLQVFDEDGNIILNMSMSILKPLGQFNIPQGVFQHRATQSIIMETGIYSGTYTNSLIQKYAGNIWYIILDYGEFSINGQHIKNIQVPTKSAPYFSWEFWGVEGKDTHPVPILYGTY